MRQLGKSKNCFQVLLHSALQEPQRRKSSTPLSEEAGRGGSMEDNPLPQSLERILQNPTMGPQKELTW